MIFHLHREFWFGATGVDLFFVLSGYLISAIIIANRHRPGFLRTFYARRALRILPIYYLVVVSVFLVNLLFEHPRPTSGYLYYLVYLQNTPYYWGITPPHIALPVGHTWTLAIEEQFYLIWPCVLLLAPARLACLCIGLTLFSSAVRYEGLHAGTLFGHMDGLSLGALLAVLQARWHWFRTRTAAACLLASAAAAFIIYFAAWRLCSIQCLETAKSFRGNAGTLIISIAYFGLIGGLSILSGARSLAFIRLRLLTRLGTISYGLYLYHEVVFEAVDNSITFQPGNGRLWLDALKIAATVVLACLSWRFIEKPILNLKDRFNYIGKVDEGGRAKFQTECATQLRIPC